MDAIVTSENNALKAISPLCAVASGAALEAGAQPILEVLAQPSRSGNDCCQGCQMSFPRTWSKYRGSDQPVMAWMGAFDTMITDVFAETDPRLQAHYDEELKG